MRSFQHGNASSIEEAVEALSEVSLPFAGGTDLLALMKEDLMAPERLVNLKTIPGLDGIVERAGGNRTTWHLGALTTLSMLAHDPALSAVPGMHCLVQAARESASPQLRHMATLGGNLVQRPRCWYFRNRHVPCWRKGGRRCFAFKGENKYHTILGGGPCYAVHPSDPAVALLALDASLLMISPNQRRTLPLEDFYVMPRPDRQREDGYHPVTVLAPNELIVEILVPPPAEGARSMYVKRTERGAWDFALVSAAVSLTMEGEVVQDARVALGGVAPIPWRAREVEEMLVGQPLSPEIIERAAEAAVREAKPLEHNAYKLELVKGTLRQALQL
jgi:xanthine dehydrogenase YagS FAD-binding subunit